METLRSALIGLGLLGWVATYGLLVRRAFQRDILWGFFALFCVPFGGWLHGFTDRNHHDRKVILLNAGSVVGIAAVLLLFPRPSLVGYWANDDRSILVRFEADGSIRNYDLGADAHYSFRGIRLATIELSIASATRLSIEGWGDLAYGYYRPSAQTIDLYTAASDPERVSRTDRSFGHEELHRLREPLDETTSAMLACLEEREAVLAAVQRFFTQPARPPLSPSVLSRYAFHVDAARTWDAATLARQPFPYVAEVLRLRAMYGTALRSGASAADLFQRDIAEDGLRIRKLSTFEVYDVRLYPEGRQAWIGLRHTTPGGETVFANLTAERLANGLWGLDVDWQWRVGVPGTRPDGSPRTVDEAIALVRDTFGVPPSTAWLQPAFERATLSR